MDNALIPWFILVPVTNKTELFQLDAEEQYLVQQEINGLSAFLMTQPNVDKINIGALGNLVPQLHIHVIGRNADDYCWPAPVWGQPRQATYPANDVHRLSQQFADYISQQQINFTAALKLRPI